MTEYEGFRLVKEHCGTAVEFIMPQELAGFFFAKLYVRCPVNDAAEGDPAEVWKKLSPLYGGRPLIAPRQVHGTTVLSACVGLCLPERPEADGLLSEYDTLPLLSLRFADCAPVVLCGAGRAPWLAVIHSGLKGTMKNISNDALCAVFKRHPEQRCENIWAWIGPSIGNNCYSRRKNDSVTASALRTFSQGNYTERSGLFYFDIKGEIFRQLAEAGLPENNIYVYGGCTCCNKDIFYSYRGGDLEKRNFLLAGTVKNL